MKHFFDSCALCGTLLSGFALLPPILTALASGVAFIWYCIQIYNWWKHTRKSL